MSSKEHWNIIVKSVWPMFIQDFAELNKHDVRTAGGKGASLGEMTGAGIPVPPGFVVLAGAFERGP